MRILPVALYFHRDERSMLEAAHQVSSLTHAHPRSLMCCGIYCLIVSSALGRKDRHAAYRKAIRTANRFYRGKPWDTERRHLERVLSGDISALKKSDLRSSGYVVDSLEVASWCFLNCQSFRESVLTAVNLGGDADTAGCVAGGLAGCFYGGSQIPDDWIKALGRSHDIACLAERFSQTVINR